MKYKLTENTKEIGNITLYQIEALKDFCNVRKGDLGGWIEKEENLSQDGKCWVSDNAQVFGNTRVSCNAIVYENACVYGNAKVYDNVEVSGIAKVYGNSWVYGYASVYGNAKVYGNTKVSGNAKVYGNARVFDSAIVLSSASIRSKSDYMCFQNFGSEQRRTTIFRTKNNDAYVKCGCFGGSLDEFEERVKKTHGENEFAQEYLAIIEVARIREKRWLNECI